MRLGVLVMARSKLCRIHSLALAICAIAALALTAPVAAQHSGVTAVRGGGYYGGYRVRYYGGYGGYYRYRGWYGGYYPWVWRYYYSSYWYGGGIPYYYAGNTYFLRDPTVGPYLAVAQPTAAAYQPRQVWSEVIVYPKNGQSQYQQTTDRYECYRWAVSQLGYDPTSAGGGTVRGDLTDYNRAQTACLDGRGYSVK
jgi:hypothetical protein